MILILTSKQDVHADEVIRRLSRRGLPVFRLNSEDTLTRYKFDLTLERHGHWAGRCVDELGREISLEDLRVAWYRKPSFDFDYEFGFDEEAKKFAGSEIRSLYEVLYTLPNVQWINPPYAADRAKSKFQQLLIAAEHGIRAPRTLITTNPTTAEQFFRACGESILVKAIYTSNATIDGRSRGIPSIRIGPAEFYAYIDQIRLSPVQLQEYVDKLYEVRVTLFGENVFAVRIDSQENEATRVDWRLHAELNKYSVMQLPEAVQAFCHALLRTHGLGYGAMDFIVTPSGDYVFLENNPFGQYLWLELETGAPLSDAMCDLLQSYL